MTALASYSTGTVAVAADGTTVTGTGTLWLSAGNAKPGDFFQVGHFGVFVTDVSDDTSLVIPPWPGTTVSGAAYNIWKVSQQRIVGATAAEDVDKIVGALNTSGYFVFVGAGLTEPDPSLGEEEQFAFQPATGKLWEMSGGVWTFLGIYRGFNFTGDYDNATVYSYGDVQTTSGTSYIYINATPSAGHTAPNATYWQVLASKGNTGGVGPTGATGAGATGQCRLVKSGANLVLQPLNGNLIRINGQTCTVPNAGVSLAATGLTPGTSYFIYATQSGGVVNALEASTTGHATSSTSGNEGVEIKSGDDTRTLVGFARVVAGPAWVDSETQRFVRSWFNDNGVETKNTINSGARPTRSNVAPTFAEIDSSYRIECLFWAGERWVLDGSGGGWLGAAGAVYFAIGVDGVTPEQGGCFGNSSASGVTVSLNAASLKGVTEGYHYATMLGAVSSNTATYISSGVDPLGCTVRGVARR